MRLPGDRGQRNQVNDEHRRKTSTGTFTLIQPEPEAEPDPIPARESLLLVVILGPTGIGKTALAIQIAQALDGEIISADSRQLYRYMDIGTAKPTVAERAAVPHHLIDVVTPDHTYSLAQFQRAAYETIDAIHVRDKLPFLVGGTGQYISAVVEGWGIPEVPPNPTTRARLEAFAEEHGAAALHRRLHDVDPEAADRLDYRNVRRVVRALEVYLETGTPITVLQRKTQPPYRLLQIGLTMPREPLYARVDARVEAMIAAGLQAEVRSLLETGYTWDCPAMSGLGYGQWRSYFAGEISEADVIDAIKHATHAFIRRQYTWFRGHDAGIHWLDVATMTPDVLIETALKRIQDWKL
ncbi:MAG: tRNA (adenosine(37)-N6)-dimethylallyltransferase MiaA [Anaerolineae bacterium]|nr:tRNA (adenosine(37)-N6)-dimethylallyltransferase MiaA [Anaerolineae bacterium]